MDPSNPTRPTLSLLRKETIDPNKNGPVGVTNEDLAALFAGLSAKVQVTEKALREDLALEAELRRRRERADSDRDKQIGNCLAAASRAQSEASQTKAIAGRVEAALNRLEPVITRLDATVGSFPASEDVVRAMQRESQRDITPAQLVEREAEIRRAADGTGLCGMVMRGAQTDVAHADQLRAIAREAAKEAASEGAAIGVVEGARAGAALVKRGQNTRTTATIAVASTGTVGVLVTVLLSLGPDGGARVAGAIRSFFGVLFGGLFG